ncbi:MAG: hypothetical protein KJN63_06140 [Acidimicrobiia bacterium]|nr:hypothetical protein [Acidimicrobiia bacterium]
MILWLDVIGAVLVIASVSIWMWRYMQARFSPWSDLDRHSLPDDQLGL